MARIRIGIAPIKKQSVEIPYIELSHSNFQIQFDEKPSYTKVTTFIMDNETSLVIESKDEMKVSLDEMIGLAKSTA